MTLEMGGPWHFLDIVPMLILNFHPGKYVTLTWVRDGILIQINYSGQLTTVSKPCEVNQPYHSHGQTLHLYPPSSSNPLHLSATL